MYSHLCNCTMKLCNSKNYRTPLSFFRNPSSVTVTQLEHSSNNNLRSLTKSNSHNIIRNTWIMATNIYQTNATFGSYDLSSWYISLENWFCKVYGRGTGDSRSRIQKLPRSIYVHRILSNMLDGMFCENS